MLRSIDTSFFATGFKDDITRHRDLRELHFGEHEGLHFDNLPPKEKARFADPNFKAVAGESWSDVRLRAIKFLASLDKGTHLCFTHGGLITAYLQAQGLKEMPTNGSVLGVTVSEDGQAETL